MRRIAAGVLLLSLLALCASCRGDETAKQTNQPAQASQPGGCPKLEGSYFGSDKSEVSRGEAVELRWRVPFAYFKSAHVEGLEGAATGVKVQGYNEDAPPEFMETSYEGVTPERTTTYTMKATGPAGCEPLTLQTVVKVNGEAGQD